MRLSRRQDLLLVALLVLTVGMMILPMPTMLADILIALNISISTVLMMVAVYISSPVMFSTLPVIILVTTAFRLALSITTSRMVLVEADAGEIIRTFGEFVISGNVVVGIVVYLIITIVQFLVITKGSERVAEVAARFSLDALPGRQMSIDTDLKNGDITQEEARNRRNRLQKESQLYGAMDGAMKFVKGDAIASLIIIVVNLIGGIAIGCLQKSMSFSTALQTYSLLAVGDGLIAQIPALLISLTAGVVVTRVTHEDGGGNLGRDILQQISAEPQSLQVAAVVMGALALVPGFPAAVFLCFGCILGGASWLLLKRQQREQATAFAISASQNHTLATSLSVQVHLGTAFSILHDATQKQITHRIHSLSEQLGLMLPPVQMTMDARQEPNSFSIDIDGVPALIVPLDPELVFVEELPNVLQELGLDFCRTSGPFGPETIAVSPMALPAIQEAGLLTIAPADFICRTAEATLLAHAGQLVGIQETQIFVRRAEKLLPDLVREAGKVCPLPRMSDVLRLLLEERVALRNIRTIFETIAEWASKEQTTSGLVERVRLALRRQICHQSSNNDKVLAAIGIDAPLENTLRSLVQNGPQGRQIDLAPVSAKRLIETSRALLAPCLLHDRKGVFLVAPDLRRPTSLLLRHYGLNVPVISYDEVAPEFSVKLHGTLSEAIIATPPATFDAA
nr:type III secretion system export apparatus subunit SctV [uncultured Acetobacter sp.]